MINLNALSRVRDKIEAARVRAGLKSTCPIEIVAVTKNLSQEAITSAYQAGIFSIGENRVKEAEKKFATLPNYKNLKRRLIGHLQSNKAKLATTIFDTIDSIDSIKLGKKLSSIGVQKGISIPVLLQVNTSQDPSKYGFNPYDIDLLLELVEEPGIRVEGLMTIGFLTSNEKIIRKTFGDLRRLKEKLNQQLEPRKKLIHLSMGMSADYEIAVEEGATMVRLGTVLFESSKS